MIRTASLFFILLLVPGPAGAQMPGIPKVMITEVSWANPDGVELTNFKATSVNLAGWKVKWRYNGTTLVSSSLDTIIGPGEVIVVKEPGPWSWPEVPPGTQVLSLLPSIGTTSQSLVVALTTLGGAVHDEVRISDTAGGYSQGSLGGTFRGLAVRGVISSGTGGSGSVERLWGLDSECGRDWTDQAGTSMGIESRSGGPRGTDTVPLQDVRINEVDPAFGYVELVNKDASTVNLQGWTLRCSGGQGQAHEVIAPFDFVTFLASDAYVVLGNDAQTPVEMPGGVAYFDLGQGPSGALPWSPLQEFDCALYDDLGRLVDLVRAVAPGSFVVHNHPRAPASWSDFVGAAEPVLNSGSFAIARSASSADTDSGADWRSVFTRTMGSTNTAFVSFGGHADAYDVRLNDGPGQGLTAILNAGPTHAGHTFSFLFSFGHHNGQGPFFGLGPDALANWMFTLSTPPFSGPLDAQGSARIDLFPGGLPSGVDLDALFILQDPVLLSTYTPILEFDT